MSLFYILVRLWAILRADGWKARGSPLSPVIANVFMEDLEERALAQVNYKPLCWFRYVDDVFVIWLHGTENLERFRDNLNVLHRNIQFTMKTERDGHLPLLDINIYRGPDGSMGHNVCRKPSHTNL
jgi:hypothetical protein